MFRDNEIRAVVETVVNIEQTLRGIRLDANNRSGVDENAGCPKPECVQKSMLD